MDVAAEQREIVEALGKSVVTSLAPAELPLFDAMSHAYFDASERARLKKDGSEETLGFGVGEAVVLLTPIVLAAATNVAIFVLNEIGKTATKLTAQQIVRQIKKLFVHQPETVRLDEAQLAQVRVIVLRTARQFRLAEGKATLLADTLVSHFATNGSE